MILDEICAHKRVEVDEAKHRVPLHELEERLEQRRKPRDFRGALRQEGISLIAEVKRASPTLGTFMENIDPAELAGVYKQSGARAISVLTDEKFFKGTLADLSAVHAAVPIPCLRKEFVIDEYQIYEARAAEADAILLIVKCLSDQQIKDYLQLARRLGMAVLVETHTAEEIERAISAGAHIIGINNRDLTTFTVDINITLELKKHVPGGYVLVSESGIHTREHVRRLDDGGIDAILVGEALVKSGDVSGKIRELLGLGDGL
ncbi:MAG: indole-3-glycerol phosphate synthase TrpC [Candidatus Hydrogenedentes bacterium]|nr:indole-3-glycerol phosphate synthase TrpC [Candidatus Hydrogenedentota bacterium]